MNTDASFGQRMAALRATRGEPNRGGPGRKPFAEKYGPQVRAAERTLAAALPQTAERYVEELERLEPERCPEHNKILECAACGALSQRRVFDHKAAAYLLDRFMGKPTTRTENTMTVKFVQQITVAFLQVFEDVNGLDDPAARSQAFGERCLELGAQYSGTAV